MTNEIMIPTIEALPAVARDPESVLNEARKAAKSLGAVIAGKAKPVIFNGEQYLEFEDWQTVGQFYGYTVRTHDAEFVEIDGTKGAKAKADLINRDGVIVGGAESYCMRDEPNWKSKPWFQLASMAQTRSGSKALRNRLSWVVVLAGYKTTPAEEMESVTAPFEKPQTANPTGAPLAQGANPLKTMVAEIKDWISVMAGHDMLKMDALLKEITKWKAKDSGEEKFLTFEGLQRMPANKMDWIKRIHDKVSTQYNDYVAGSAQ